MLFHYAKGIFQTKLIAYSNTYFGATMSDGLENYLDPLISTQVGAKF